MEFSCAYSPCPGRRPILLLHAPLFLDSVVPSTHPIHPPAAVICAMPPENFASLEEHHRAIKPGDVIGRMQPTSFFFVHVPHLRFSNNLTLCVKFFLVRKRAVLLIHDASRRPYCQRGIITHGYNGAVCLQMLTQWLFKFLVEGFRLRETDMSTVNMY
jgi:hypothetical protein